MEEVWTAESGFPITDIGNLRRASACCGFDMKKQRVNRSLSKAHQGFRDHHSRLLSLDFLMALLVRRALAFSDFIEGAPLRLHPHVGVSREHGARDVSGDAH